MTLTKKSRRELSARAHHLEPMVIIGKDGVKGGTFQVVREIILAHELIKIRFNDFKEEKQELIDTICNGVGAIHVRTTGHVAILYKAKIAKTKK